MPLLTFQNDYSKGRFHLYRTTIIVLVTIAFGKFFARGLPFGEMLFYIFKVQLIVLHNRERIIKMVQQLFPFLIFR